MATKQCWERRSPQRLPDELWHATLTRVRGEFEEMRCMRVTREQAGTLLGVQEPAVTWVLDRLAREGFLSRTAQGEYTRRGPTV